MKKFIEKNATKLKAMGTAVTTSMILTTANVYAAEDHLAKGVGFLSTAVTILGGAWTIWGVVLVASSLNDHNGQQMKDGMTKAIGGAMMVAVATWFTTLDVSFG